MLQKSIQHAIDELVDQGEEVAVQVAVYRDGEQIVDAVAGPVDSGTPVYTWSMGKGMTAATVNLLVERGVFTYDTRIAELWPEFGAHGKQTATVRNVLQHTAGVPGIGTDTTADDVCDWDRICARIAAMEPWWEPGTQTGYHAYTFGFLCGEIVRRATGRTISQVLASEIATPLGVPGELYFGVPAAEQHRLLPLVDPPGPQDDFFGSLPPDSPMLRASSLELWPTAELGNRADVLAADIPAGGKMTARAMARLYASLIGEVDGVRLLPADRVRAIVEDRFSGPDRVFGGEATWGLGFALGGLPGTDPAAHPNAFGMAGSGGTFGFADPDTGIAFALTKNLQTMNFTAVERTLPLVFA